MVFVPLHLQPANIPHAFRLNGLIPCGQGIDLLWGSGSACLMRSKGVLEPVFRAGGDQQFGQACFDGKYAWLPVVGGRSLVLAIDPSTGSVVRFDAGDGLPAFQFASSAALGHGRACLSAAFGNQSDRRACVAVLELAANGSKSVRIIHESHAPRKFPDEPERTAERDPRLSYIPGFMLSQPAENGKSWTVLIKRRFHHSCLSIDPDAKLVQVVMLKTESVEQDDVTFHQNGAFWGCLGFAEPSLYR